MNTNPSLEWTNERPQGTDEKVVKDITSSLSYLKRPEDLIFHTVFLGDDTDYDPGVIVEGKAGHPNFVCTYYPVIGEAYVEIQPNLKIRKHNPTTGLGIPLMTKSPQKRALLIVDVQNGFCPGGNLPVTEGDKIVPIINAMMASGFYDIIVASQDWHPDGHGSFATSQGKKPFEMGELCGQPQVMWPDHCVQGTLDAEFHPDLEISRIDFIQQKGQDPQVDSYSAFRDNSESTKTGLDEWLISHNVSQIDVCGLATDFCVKFSALDAIRMMPTPCNVRFIEDASRGISDEGVTCAKQEMVKAGIEIINSSLILTKTAKPS